MFLRFHAPEKGPLSAKYTQTVILNAEIWHQCPLAANRPSLSSTLPLGLDSSLFYSHHPKDGWRPLKNEIERVTFLSAVFKEMSEGSKFCWLLRRKSGPLHFKNSPSLAGCECLCAFVFCRGGGGGVVIKWFSRLPPNPDARPLGTYETKMVARTGKCSMLTILPGKRGLHEQSWCCSAAGIYTQLECTTAPSIYIMGKPFSHCILPTDDASHVNNACSRITSLCTRLGSIFPKFNTPRDAATATQIKPHAA